MVRSATGKSGVDTCAHTDCESSPRCSPFALPGFTPSSAPASPSAPTSFLNDTEANESAATAADLVDPVLRGDASYAGDRIVAEGLEVSVVGQPSPAVVAAIALARKVAPVVVRTVAHSQADLLDLNSRLVDDADLWRGRGIVFASSGPDVESNTVLVELERFSDEAEQALMAAYSGPEWITVSHRSIKERGLAQDRRNDPGIKQGGDSILNTQHDCTSWFQTISNLSSNEYGFTSAHCLSGGWYDEANNFFGTTTTTRWGGNMDAQSIRVSDGAGTVWADPYIIWRNVRTKALSNPPGAVLCTDGKNYGERCNVRVYSEHQTFYPNNAPSISDAVHAANFDGYSSFPPGSSGGPTYSVRTSDEAVNARGMVMGWHNATSEGFYLPSYNIEEAFNVRLLLR